MTKPPRDIIDRLDDLLPTLSVRGVSGRAVLDAKREIVRLREAAFFAANLLEADREALRDIMTYDANNLYEAINTLRDAIGYWMPKQQEAE